jgi:hypothetical protein
LSWKEYSWVDDEHMGEELFKLWRKCLLPIQVLGDDFLS